MRESRRYVQPSYPKVPQVPVVVVAGKVLWAIKLTVTNDKYSSIEVSYGSAL